MTKYEPLTTHLRAQNVDRIPMSFADIERIIGFELPRSARLHRAWWSNNGSNNVMTGAWLDAGFQSEQVDLQGRKLTFRRTGPAAQPLVYASPSTPAGVPPVRPALFGCMKGTISIAPGDLTAPADPQWAQQPGDR